MSQELLSLVKACKSGNKEAWELFVQDGGKIIRSYLVRYCGEKGDEINDITQMVWIKLFKGGLRDFAGTSKYQLLAYLKKIAINEAHTHFRLRVKPKGEISGDQIAKPDDKGQSRKITDESAGPEEVVILKGEVERLRECLKGLPVVQQEIAMMKAKDYKDSEIGEILGLPLGTVAVSYSRLKKKLRECIEKL